MYLHKLKIGNVELKNNIILAPMAGITDLPFRIVCEEFNPGMVVTEMISSRGIYYNDFKTKKLLDISEDKTIVAVQLFGNDPEIMGLAAKEVSKSAPIIDINMGCPAPKIVKNGDGSSLLLNLEKAGQIMEAVVKNSTVPVMVKYRKGWNNENIVAIDIAKLAEEKGISAITIHGRTREEFYSGEVDKEIIKKVKNTISIPVIASGDIINEQTALQMFETTGVDGIMIGRGAFGNPWIIERIIHFLEAGDELTIPSYKERKELIKKHIELAVNKNGEEIAIKEMRKHLAQYVKNMPNSSEFRNNINKLETKKEVIEAIDEYFNMIMNKNG